MFWTTFALDQLQYYGICLYQPIVSFRVLLSNQELQQKDPWNIFVRERERGSRELSANFSTLIVLSFGHATRTLHGINC